MRALAALALLAATATPAAAERPGDFDFYVLSLSWSPSYCEAEGNDRAAAECAGGRPYAFVVHGLWPQYERGFPADCDSPDWPSRRAVDAMTDVMPDPGLVRHEWRKHGTCSGLGPDAYFATLRAARAKVTIPDAFRRLSTYLTTTPAAIERAFLAANPAIKADGIAVTCDRRRLREVRVCLTPSLDFRACGEVDRRACDQPKVVLPPVR